MSQEPERRQQERAPIELKVEYQRLNAFFSDYTRNISRGGTFIKTERPLAIGTRFVFRLIVPSLPDALVLAGEVRWAPKPGEGEPGMGIRFLFDDGAQREAVERVVEKIMVESLGPLIYARLRERPS